MGKEIPASKLELEMSSSSGAAETLTSPAGQQANAPVATTTMDAKLTVATASGDVQQLKDLVNKQEEDSTMMVVAMAKQQAAAAASAGYPHPHKGNMDPRLLALASSGSSEELQTLLNGEHGQASGCSGNHGSLPIRRAWRGSLQKVTLHSMWWPLVVRAMTSLPAGGVGA